jgi:hypothetical protein
LPENYHCSVASCRATTDLHMDHDHACCGPDGGKNRTRNACGNCNRGWLCRYCNIALGAAKDDPRRLRALAEYLEAYAATS